MWNFLQRAQNPSFPFDVLEKTSLNSDRPYELYNGKSRETNEPVTIFKYKKPSSPDELNLLRNLVKRLKTLRHPGILNFKGSHEGASSVLSSSDGCISIATEYVEPLSSHLMSVKQEMTEEQYHEYIISGFYQIMKVVSFLHSDAKLRHNNICHESVFVNSYLDWKLGDLTYVTNLDEHYPAKVTRLKKYDPPEVSCTDRDLQNSNSDAPWAQDSWGLGVLVWELFNIPLESPSNLKQVSKIPRLLKPMYCELVANSPKVRLRPSELTKRSSSSDDVFSNTLINTLMFLEEIQIKEKESKSEFFSNLLKDIDRKKIPNIILVKKILPLIMNALEYGEAGVSVLDPLLKIGRVVSDKEFEEKIVPCLVKLYMSNDRATRSKLLHHVPEYISHFPAKVINDTLFQLLIVGFYDTHATIRDMTIRAFEHIAPKLNSNNLNQELLKCFSRLQTHDPHEGVRASTTVCLAKIASNLNPATRQKILISAFLRALKDPSPGGRMAGILGLITTQECYSMNEIATRVLPNLSLFTIDKDYQVRLNAFKAIKSLVDSLESFSESPEVKDNIEEHLNDEPSGSTDQIGVWTQWAVSALKSFKIVRAQEETQGEKQKEMKSPTGQPPQDKKSAALERNEKESNILSPVRPAQTLVEKQKNPKVEEFDITSSNNTTSSQANNDLEGWDDFDSWVSLEEDTSSSQQPNPSLRPVQPTVSQMNEDLISFAEPIPKPREAKSRPLKLGAKKHPK